VADFKKILDDVGAYSGDTGDGLVDLNIPRSGSASVNYPSDGLLDLNPVTGKITLPPDGFFDTPSPTPPPSDTPYSFPSIRGAAISVKDKLANISFVEGSAGEMSASIAYIRYWSRKGTQQKTAVGDTPIDGAVFDPQQQLAANFSSLSGFNPITQNFSSSGDGFSNFPISNPSRTVLTIPTNTAYQSRPRQPVPTTTTSPRPAGPSFLNRLGSIFSANPGGAAAPPWANPFYTPAAAPAPDGAVWQFLFNPEELQLSSGPDFNRAETWGVDTAGNSGQPLSWRSNKNRKLTFGKVLLHGYTFGKRVDSLENGLQELFQARDGENGADGPPVLEFVWGQRVFGPCVIQNIQVREKAWDKGLLVNAEVSFDLEQVPEWTINDGFVDVLRPGRQSTINDPSLPGRTDTGTTGSSDDTTPPPADRPGGGGGQQSADLSSCSSLLSDQKKINSFIYEVGKRMEGTSLQKTQSSSSSLIGPIFPLVKQYNPNFTLLLSKYKNLLVQFKSNRVYGPQIKDSIIGFECVDTIDRLEASYTPTINSANTPDKIKRTDNFYNNKLRVCSRNIESIIKKSLNENCSAFSAPQGGRQGPGLF
jgi:hypothetical protein